jgi:hypothetical protein
MVNLLLDSTIEKNIKYFFNSILILILDFELVQIIKWGLGIGDWGLGIGDWGLGIGDWAQ